jgi:hypothetical protein
VTDRLDDFVAIEDDAPEHKLPLMGMKTGSSQANVAANGKQRGSPEPLGMTVRRWKAITIGLNGLC